jgi:hypothetical protein
MRASLATSEGEDLGAWLIGSRWQHSLSGHRTHNPWRMCAVFRVYSPKCLEEEFSEVRGYKVRPHSPAPVAIEAPLELFGPQTGP